MGGEHASAFKPARDVRAFAQPSSALQNRLLASVPYNAQQRARLTHRLRQSGRRFITREIRRQVALLAPASAAPPKLFAPRKYDREGIVFGDRTLCCSNLDELSTNRDQGAHGKHGTAYYWVERDVSSERWRGRPKRGLGDGGCCLKSGILASGFEGGDRRLHGVVEEVRCCLFEGLVTRILTVQSISEYAELAPQPA